MASYYQDGQATGDVDLAGDQWTEAPVNVAYTVASARNGSDLSAGRYRIVSTTDCFVLQGDSSVAALTTSVYLPADTIDYIKVTTAANARLAAIRSTADGTLQIERRDP